MLSQRIEHHRPTDVTEGRSTGGNEMSVKGVAVRRGGCTEKRSRMKLLQGIPIADS
jgi:hypothetical protein